MRIETGPGVAVEVVLSGYSGDDYRRAQERVRAGDFRAPEIWRLVEALSAAVGHDLDPQDWGEADFLKLADYLGLVDEGAWGAADDRAIAALLGEGADGGR